MEIHDDESMYRIQNEQLPECDVYCTIEESLSSSHPFFALLLARIHQIQTVNQSEASPQRIL